jgi:hypothetical protein
MLLPYICLPGEYEGIHFWDGGTYKVDSITLNDRMIIVKMMTSKGDLWFNVGSKPQWGPGIPPITKLMPCQSVEFPARGKNLTGSSPYQIHNPQHKRPAPYS